MNRLAILVFELHSYISEKDLLLLFDGGIAFNDLFHDLSEVKCTAIDQGPATLDVLHVMELTFETLKAAPRFICLFLSLIDAVKGSEVIASAACYVLVLCILAFVESLSNEGIFSFKEVESLLTLVWVWRHHFLNCIVALFVRHLGHIVTIQWGNVNDTVNLVHIIYLCVE